MNEPEVIQRVHRFLSTEGIGGERTSRLFTDPHPTLIGYKDLRPFQRFSLDFGGFVVHPDLLGQESDADSLIAIEAKGKSDLLKGLGQAETYQNGVQRSFLAAPANALSSSLVDMARAKGVGVLSVSESVKALYIPEARRPLNKFYNSLVADLTSAACVSESGTYTYNLPTHYLVWVTALVPSVEYAVEDIRKLVDPFPIPKDWRSALRGAQKLGLLRTGGGHIGLTDIGCAVRDLLPGSTVEWANIHERLTVPRSNRTLHDEHRTSAAALKLLLLQDPIVRLVVEGLHLLGNGGGTFDRLAATCSKIDKRRSTIFFLKPEATTQWVNIDGGVDWAAVPGGDYRSSTFFQYKSVLKHAGLIMPHNLGTASAKNYDPKTDIWELRLS